jgi:hypothetical protein
MASLGVMSIMSLKRPRMVPHKWPARSQTPQLFLDGTSIVTTGLQQRDLVMLRGHDTAALTDMLLSSMSSP